MTTIAVCIPARDQVYTSFAFDMARAVAAHTAMTDDRVLLFHSLGTLICNQRQELAKEAIRAGADKILYLDSDMRFPKDTISRLLAHGEPVVACNYSTRRHPLIPVAFGSASLQVGDRVWTYPESTGLESVHAVGMGVFMVDTALIREMPLPWFHIGYLEQAQDFVGEDMFFCKRLRDAGQTIWIDHDLSKEVRHIGTWEYSTENACDVRAAAE